MPRTDERHRPQPPRLLLACPPEPQSHGRVGSPYQSEDLLEAGDDAAKVQLGHADGRMVRRYSVAADAVLGQAVAAKHA